MTPEEMVDGLCKWGSNSGLRDAVLGAIKQAVADERERCAGIAKRYAWQAGQGHWQDGMIQAGQIAHEIETGNRSSQE